MDASNARETDMESDASGSRNVPNNPAPLELRRRQGGQPASDILYNLEQLYMLGQFRVGHAHRAAVRSDL